MKAFVNSMLAITASLLLLELLFSFQAFSLRSVADQREAFDIGYSRYYVDDVKHDLRLLLNPSNLSISRHNSTTFRIAFTLSNQVSSTNNSLASYESMLSSFESKANINISLNYTNMSLGNFTIPLSSDVNFTYIPGNPDSALIYSTSQSTLTNITINVFSPYPDTSYTGPHIPQGGWQDLYIDLNYQGPDRSEKYFGYLHKNQYEHLYVEYANGTSSGLLEVTFGSTGKNGTLLYISRENVFPSVEVVLYATMDPGDMSLEYPVSVNVSYLNVSKSSSSIGVFRG